MGYHGTNLVLHAVSCCLLTKVLRRLWTGPNGRSVPVGTEWLAAGLFAVHPLCAESVAWISEQKNTLSLVFYLLAGSAYLEFSESRRAQTYAWASLLFLLALGTKSVTATLPAALGVVLWWQSGRIAWKRDLRPLLPWFGAALAAGLVTIWVERRLIGAEGASFELSAASRLLLACRILWFYAGKLAWPCNVAFFYERWDVESASRGWAPYLVLTLAVTAGL